MKSVVASRMASSAVAAAASAARSLRKEPSGDGGSSVSGPRASFSRASLGPDGGALVQVAQVIGVGLGLQQDRRDVLAAQVEVVQRRRRRRAQSGAELLRSARDGPAGRQGDTEGDDQTGGAHPPFNHDAGRFGSASAIG